MVAASLASFSVWAGSYEEFFKAIEFDSADTVKYWLGRGFDPNSPNEQLVPALILAVQKGALKSASVLIDDPKTQLDIENDKHETALMWAALNNQLVLAERLIDKGAEVNHPGWTALHYAASRNHVAMMRLLLDHSAYIDASAPNGSTPLMMAAVYGSPQAVKLLLEEGADPTVVNDSGHSAYDLAQEFHQELSAAYINAFVDAWHHQEDVDQLRAQREAEENEAQEQTDRQDSDKE
jgi:ankyrin repeat protein